MPTLQGLNPGAFLNEFSALRLGGRVSLVHVWKKKKKKKSEHGDGDGASLCCRQFVDLALSGTM